MGEDQIAMERRAKNNREKDPNTCYFIVCDKCGIEYESKCVDCPADNQVTDEKDDDYKKL